MIKENFNDRFKLLRKQKKVTQKEIAAIFGKTESLIRKYENGSAFPSVPGLIEFAKYFEVSTDYLLGLTEER